MRFAPTFVSNSGLAQDVAQCLQWMGLGVECRFDLHHIAFLDGNWGIAFFHLPDRFPFLAINREDSTFTAIQRIGLAVRLSVDE
jgi:hypothetical protein